MIRPRKRFKKLIQHEYKCLILLLIFLIYFVCEPVIDKTRLGYFYANLYIIFLIYSSYIITGSRKFFAFSAAVGVIVLALRFWFPGDISPVLMIIYGSAIIFFDFAVTISLMIYTSVTDKFRKDLIFGIIFTYFMIGMSFGDLYFVLYKWGLVSLKMPTFGEHGVNEFVYYSFSTLTTLGYGDIVPSPDCLVAMRLSSIEACTGVLYVALFIGRLLSLYSEKYKGVR